MAAGQNIPELGGYDFEFTSVVPDDFECPVCQLTMKDPIQIGGCGHRLCKICLESLLRSHSPKCPVDRQPLSRDKIFPDVAFHRQILDLEVKCSYVGCPWTGELRAVQKHQSECLFNAVECPNEGCKEKLTRRDMNNHMITECVWREVSCEYCRGSFIVKNKQQHQSVCQKFPVQCANNCGLSNISREKLVAHIRDDCPLTEIDCKYKNLGCQYVFQRRNTKSHLESHMERHLNLAVRSLETTQNQIKDQAKQIARLTSTFKDQLQQLNDQSQQLNNQLQQLNDQSQQLNNQSQQLNDQSQQLNDQSQQLNDRSQQLNDQSQQLNDQSQQLNDQSQQLNNQSQQLNDQSQQLNDQSQQIERLMAGNIEQSLQINSLMTKDMNHSQKTDRSISSLNEQSRKIASLTSTEGSLVQQEERLGDTMKQSFKPKSINDIDVGMKVLLRLGGKRRGTVKYVGPLSGSPGWLGVELDPGEERDLPWSFASRDGIHIGKRYFSCAPGRGTFAEFVDVLECYR